jgi:hypothetical protein
MEMQQDQILGNSPSGPKYILVIEGHDYPWDRDTITTEEIANLGGFQASDGVIEIDKDNNERTLAAGEVVELKPGHGFSKKVRWRRGDLFSARIEAELGLLRRYYPEVEFVASGNWFRIRHYPLPAGWNRATIEVSFQAPQAYPGGPPYGIYVPAGILFNGAVPANYQDAASNRPPFEGNWGVFSWTPESGAWATPTQDIVSGPNLLNWVQGFKVRFAEGK